MYAIVLSHAPYHDTHIHKALQWVFQPRPNKLYFHFLTPLEIILWHHYKIIFPMQLQTWFCSLHFGPSYPLTLSLRLKKKLAHLDKWVKCQTSAHHVDKFWLLPHARSIQHYTHNELSWCIFVHVEYLHVHWQELPHYHKILLKRGIKWQNSIILIA